MKILAICEHCKKEYFKTFEKQKYCGYACSIKAHTNVPTETTCLHCGKIFFVRSRRTRKFCSTSCSSLHFRSVYRGLHPKTGSVRKCKNCGKEFYTTQRTNRKYCSRFCACFDRPSVAFIKTCPVCNTAYQTRKSRPTETCSPKCAGLLKSKITARTVIKSEDMKRCCQCGYDKYPALLERHHADRDRTNNDIKNLLVLCPTCHDEIHYETKTGRFHFMGEVIQLRSKP
jgi:hypothetical protein